MSPATKTRDAVALHTPVGRDRYVDLLRVASLAAVVLGHWLMITAVPGPAGSTEITNLLAVAPGLQPVTWLLQVMPIFFLVGGFSQATAWASTRRRSGTYADYLRARAGRLLRPTAAFIACWLVLGAAVAGTGHDVGLVRVALRTVAQPLWFLGVYLAVVALAPPMWWLHRRVGRFAPAVPAGMFAAAGVVDVLRFTAGQHRLAYLNLLLVWVGVHQLGYLYADGTLQRGGRRLAGLLAGGGLAAVVALTALGPYPVSMVGVPGEAVSNMSPPTAALAAHAVWLTGLVLLLRGPLARRLARPAVWQAVIVGNIIAMTAFLWHLTAAFVAIGVGLALGWTGPPAASALWWLWRPVWVLALAAITAGLVCIFRRFDPVRPTPERTGEPASPAAPAPARWRTAAAGCGAASCVLGVLGISTVGFGGLLEGRTATLIVVPLNAAASVALVVAGAGLLALTRPRRLVR